MSQKRQFSSVESVMAHEEKSVGCWLIVGETDWGDQSTQASKLSNSSETHPTTGCPLIRFTVSSLFNITAVT